MVGFRFGFERFLGRFFAFRLRKPMTIAPPMPKTMAPITIGIIGIVELADAAEGIVGAEVGVGTALGDPASPGFRVEVVRGSEMALV